MSWRADVFDELSDVMRSGLEEFHRTSSWRVRVFDKLSDEERSALEEFYMDAFKAWMKADGERPGHEVSDDNRCQVIRQVTKLVSGVGIDYYHHWAPGVVFREGEPVTIQSDLGQIYRDARVKKPRPEVDCRVTPPPRRHQRASFYAGLRE